MMALRDARGFLVFSVQGFIFQLSFRNSLIDQFIGSRKRIDQGQNHREISDRLWHSLTHFLVYDDCVNLRNQCAALF